MSADGKTVLAKTGQLYGHSQLNDVKAVMREGLKAAGVDIPDYLA